MKGQLFLALMLTTLSMVPTLAKAGAGSSGGGNALVCFDTPEIPKQIRARNEAGNIIDGSIRNEHIAHITRVEILDLVEAQYPRGMSQPKLADLIQPTAGEEVEDYARRIIGRLKNVAPLLHDQLLERINEMPAAEATAQPDGLYPVDDYNLLGRIDSTNCVVATVAVHQFTYSDLTGNPQLYFDQRLMFHSKHSGFSRAITYLHEVVYSYARSELRHSDSQDTRKLLGVLLRKNVSIVELDQIDTESHFNRYYKFTMSQRADRLGWLYASVVEKARDIANKSFTSATSYDDEVFDAGVEELKAFGGEKCDDYDSCISFITKVSKGSAVFKKEKARIQEAARLLAKYKNLEQDSYLAAQKKLDLRLQKLLKNMYESEYQKQILELENISTIQLQQLDAAILDAINNKFDLIVKSAKDNWLNSRSFVSIFPEAMKILSTIPLQQNL